MMAERIGDVANTGVRVPTFIASMIIVGGGVLAFSAFIRSQDKEVGKLSSAVERLNATTIDLRVSVDKLASNAESAVSFSRMAEWIESFQRMNRAKIEAGELMVPPPPRGR